MGRFLLVIIILGVMVPVTRAQEESTQVVLETGDGVELVGDFWRVAESEQPAPTLLLLHSNGATRVSWEVVIPDLLAAGYQALAVDIRGHGESGGSRNMLLARDDTVAWLEWLAEQPSVDGERLGVMGSSLGAVIAIAGCGASPRCVTVISLSPQLTPVYDMAEIFGVQLADRSALVVTGQGDGGSVRALNAYMPLVRGEVMFWKFGGAQHGAVIFSARSEVREMALQFVFTWLEVQFGENAE